MKLVYSMNRHFTLEEIAFEEFNKLNERLGKPRIKLPYLKREGEMSKSKRFFKILNKINHNYFKEIFAIKSDDVGYLKCVWVPGSIPIGSARKLTLKYKEEYFKELMEKEKEYNRIIIEISTRKNYWGEWYSDTFDYKKEDNLWTLISFLINAPNFHYYTFEGIKRLNPSATCRIYGIYTG